MRGSGDLVLVQIMVVEVGEISDEGEILSTLSGWPGYYAVSPDGVWREARLGDDLERTEEGSDS